MELIEDKVLKLIQQDQEHHRSQIVLDGIYIEKISKKLKEQMEANNDVFKISLNNCHLKSLKNLPQFPLLNYLNLSRNFFSSRELKQINAYKNLQGLDLSYNKIKTMKQIENLNELENLIFLNLEGNDIQKIKNYRQKIFDIFPSLQLLDLKDKFNNHLIPSSTEADEKISQQNFNSDDSNYLNSFSESDEESDIYIPEDSESSEEKDESEDSQSKKTEKSEIDIFDQLIQKMKLEKNYYMQQREIDIRNQQMQQKLNTIKRKRCHSQNFQRNLRSNFQSRQKLKLKKIEAQNVKMFNRLQEIYTKKKRIKNTTSSQGHQNILLIKNQEKNLKKQRFDAMKKIEQENQKIVSRILNKKSRLSVFFKNKNYNQQIKSYGSQNQLPDKIFDGSKLHEQIIKFKDLSVLVQIFQKLKNVYIHFYIHQKQTSIFEERCLKFHIINCNLKRQQTCSDLQKFR